MKVICVDNFARETHDDVLVCENVNDFYGKFIVNMLNEKLSGEHSSDYYRLVEDDYKLYKYEW
ncbi:hypothetical protein CHH83_01950 [Bacillus sp. 7586-K]|nr:hypothetical protein CHH83_01950 [Bacillus sp. 7586-K]